MEASPAQPRASGIPRSSRLPLPKSNIPVSCLQISDQEAGSGSLSHRPLQASSSQTLLRKPLRATTSSANPRSLRQPASSTVSRNPIVSLNSTAPRSQVYPATAGLRKPYNPQPSSANALLSPNDFQPAPLASSDANLGHDAFDIHALGAPSTPISKKTSRPSLADRTVESLAQLTPTPRGKRRSSFFQPAESPMMHQSSSRPSSAIGKPMINPFASTPSRYATPRTAALGKAKSSFALRSPTMGAIKYEHSIDKVASTNLGGNSLERSSATLDVSSTARKSSNIVGKGRSTTVSSLTAPLNAKAPIVSAARGPLKTKQTMTVVNSTKEESAISERLTTTGKSSAALREQIQRARAQKQSLTPRPNPLSPASNFLDEAACENPFGQHPKNLVLQKRIDTARSDGRLNISALGLQELPNEVLTMYDYETNQDAGISWGEVVDLTRFIAADNEFTSFPDAAFPDVNIDDLSQDDDAPNPQFGGIEHLDLHGNRFMTLPKGLRQLRCLTVLNLSRNRIGNDVIGLISQITSLRELRLAENLLVGSLAPEVGSLENLEILDIHMNKIHELPEEMSALRNLRIMDVSGNNLKRLPSTLCEVPLTQFLAAKNTLSGVLFDQPRKVTFPHLQTLDVSMNQLTALTPSDTVVLDVPKMHTLNIGFNRITELPDLTTCQYLTTLLVQDNRLTALPSGFTDLKALRTAEFTGNDLRVLDPQVARMKKLESFVIAANPLRERKFLTMSTADLKESLKSRLEGIGSEDP